MVKTYKPWQFFCDGHPVIQPLGIWSMAASPVRRLQRAAAWSSCSWPRPSSPRSARPNDAPAAPGPAGGKLGRFKDYGSGIWFKHEKNDEKIRIKNMFNQIRKRQERSIQISGF